MVTAYFLFVTLKHGKKVFNPVSLGTFIKPLGCIKCSSQGKGLLPFFSYIKTHAILAPLRKRNMFIDIKKSRGGSQ